LVTAGKSSLNVFASFHTSGPNAVLTNLCSDLLAQQRFAWPYLAEGVASLESVRDREIVCNGFTVHVQFNPKRIVSTGANVDPAVVSKRTCFLCPENLPPEQQGVLYRDEYLILCNPVPIFPGHLTISSTHHLPQDFDSSVDTMFELAQDLSPDYSVFYNGPRCGASAPDHLHFQASPRRAIPVEVDAVDVRRRKRFYYKNHVVGFTLMKYGRAVVMLESSERKHLRAFLHTLVLRWKELLHSSEEPMMNVICSYQQNIWRLIIFPRRKHRPELYFLEGNDRMIISPAAVDMGGMIVTPRERDFLRVDASVIETIFSEVSENQEVIDTLLENLV
jgi:hypothetical protein